MAIKNGNIEIIKLLLSSEKFDVNLPFRGYRSNGIPIEQIEDEIKFCKTEEMREKFRNYLKWQYSIRSIHSYSFLLNVHKKFRKMNSNMENVEKYGKFMDFFI